MKNTPSISSHDSISSEDVHEPINNNDFETHVETPEEDNNTVTRKDKRQRVAKFFGEDFIIQLAEDTPTTIAEAYSSIDADL